MSEKIHFETRYTEHSSDNASSFKSADKILSKEGVQNFASSKKIDWQFTTTCAPWMGGFYERLIREVKTALKKVLGRQTLTMEELRTVICEVEGVLNSRPLTYVSDEFDEVLTPSHFLVLQRLTKEGSSEKNVVSPTVPSIKFCRYLLNRFWDVWQRSYILSLRERSLSGVHRKRGSSDSAKVGDVCLIVDKGPRLQWRLAKIVGLNAGRDGICRSASLKTSNDRVIRRPISLLVPLEILCKFQGGV